MNRRIPRLLGAAAIACGLTLGNFINATAGGKWRTGLDDR